MRTSSIQNKVSRKFHRFYADTAEKAMAPHSSTLAWKIPWTKEPGRLQSMGSWRVRHNWATSLSLFTFMHWRKKRQPIPVFLPGESQDGGGLVASMGSHRVGHDWSDLAASASACWYWPRVMKWVFSWAVPTTVEMWACWASWPHPSWEWHRY